VLKLLVLKLVVDRRLKRLFQVKLWHVEHILADLTDAHPDLRDFLVAIHVTDALEFGTHVVKQTTEAFRKDKIIPFLEALDSCRPLFGVTVDHLGDQLNVDWLQAKAL
jgi:hypothetical protein